MQDQDQKIDRRMQALSFSSLRETPRTSPALEQPCVNPSDIQTKGAAVAFSALEEQGARRAPVLAQDLKTDPHARETTSLTMVKERPNRPANKYERVEIEALIFYAVQKTGLALEALRREILEGLSLVAFESMSAGDYQRTRDYLWARLGAT